MDGEIPVGDEQLTHKSANTKTSKRAPEFVQIPDVNVECVYEVSPESKAKDRTPAVVNPDFFSEKGTPTDEDGEDMQYKYTQIKRTTIVVHVRGGVAYPPNRLPRHINLKIIDHDNNSHHRDALKRM